MYTTLIPVRNSFPFWGKGRLVAKFLWSSTQGCRLPSCGLSSCRASAGCPIPSAVRPKNNRDLSKINLRLKFERIFWSTFGYLKRRNRDWDETNSKSISFFLAPLEPWARDRSIFANAYFSTWPPAKPKILDLQLWLLFHTFFPNVMWNWKPHPNKKKQQIQDDTRARTLISACWHSRSTTKKFAGSVNGFHHWEVPHLHPKGTRQKEAGLHWNEAARLHRTHQDGQWWAMMLHLWAPNALRTCCLSPSVVFLIDTWTSYLIAWHKRGWFGIMSITVCWGCLKHQY